MGLGARASADKVKQRRASRRNDLENERRKREANKAFKIRQMTGGGRSHGGEWDLIVARVPSKQEVMEVNRRPKVQQAPNNLQAAGPRFKPPGGASGKWNSHWAITSVGFMDRSVQMCFFFPQVTTWRKHWRWWRIFWDCVQKSQRWVSLWLSWAVSVNYQPGETKKLSQGLKLIIFRCFVQSLAAL